MSSVWSARSAVTSALAAPVLLLLAASAGPAAAQGGTAENGTYYVRDAATGRCLAGTQLATCGTVGTEWTLRNHEDGTVQFQEAGTDGRCLALPEALAYPVAVLMNTCEPATSADPSPSPSADAADGEGATDRWRIEGLVDSPVTIAHAYPPAGRLAVQGSDVQVSNNSSAMWVLVPVAK